jgi:hypothetical protein
MKKQKSIDAFAALEMLIKLFPKEFHLQMCLKALDLLLLKII